MNEKEIGEIRRRVRRDRSNMTAIYGCYVNSQKEIISSFRQSVAMMSENEAEKYFSVMKRTLSGGVGKNLIDVSFRTAQVADSPEHKLLMDLRRTGLQDDERRMELYRKIMDSVSFDESYLILVGCDSYDVPFKSKDGQIHKDASADVYTYLLCAVCPVKQAKNGLHYMAQEKIFHDGGVVQSVCAPELGFLFPAFDDRSANIYGALMYTHSTKKSNQSFADALFSVELPKPAAEQKKSFEALMTTALRDECSLDVVQTVHDQICQTIALHKESKDPQTLLVSKAQIKTALKSGGVSESAVAKFSVDYDAAFGFEAQLHPKNIIDDRHFEIKTPDVSIKVNPERSDLIETRVIGGVKYILICADENVEVNGVNINITDDKNESSNLSCCGTGD